MIVPAVREYWCSHFVQMQMNFALIQQALCPHFSQMNPFYHLGEMDNRI